MPITRTFSLAAGLVAMTVAGCGASNPGIEKGELDDCMTQQAQLRAKLDRAREQRLDAVSRDNREGDALQFADRRMSDYQAIAQQLRDAFISPQDHFEFTIRNGQLVLHMPNEILFKEGSAKLEPSGIEVVKKLAGVLSTIPDREFLVAGYTDNVPVAPDTSEYSSNWQLSTQRALAVVMRLINEGVPPDQLGVAGFGMYLPEASNDTPEGRAENRRTEIIVMPTVDELPEMPKNL